MASVKVISLAIKTLSKPIATRIKQQATEHARFRTFCVEVAQAVHRFELRAASANVFGKQLQVRPLTEAKAIQQGANFISESFLFLVALSLILAETMRSRSKTADRRDLVDESIQNVDDRIATLSSQVEDYITKANEMLHHNQHQHGEIIDLLVQSHPHLISQQVNRPRTLSRDPLVLRAELALAPQNTTSVA